MEDFNEWISNNQLDSIKHIFIKHNLTDLNEMKMNSNKFYEFIGKLVLSKNDNFINKIITAINNIPFQSRFIIQELNQQHSKLTKLNDNIKQKCDQEMYNVDNKIKNIFNDIQNQVNIELDDLQKKTKYKLHQTIQNMRNEAKYLIDESIKILEKSINDTNKEKLINCIKDKNTKSLYKIQEKIQKNIQKIKNMEFQIKIIKNEREINQLVTNIKNIDVIMNINHENILNLNKSNFTKNIIFDDNNNNNNNKNEDFNNQDNKSCQNVINNIDIPYLESFEEWTNDQCNKYHNQEKQNILIPYSQYPNFIQILSVTNLFIKIEITVKENYKKNKKFIVRLCKDKKIICEDTIIVKWDYWICYYEEYFYLNFDETGKEYQIGLYDGKEIVSNIINIYVPTQQEYNNRRKAINSISLNSIKYYIHKNDKEENILIIWDLPKYIYSERIQYKISWKCCNDKEKKILEYLPLIINKNKFHLINDIQIDVLIDQPIQTSISRNYKQQRGKLIMIDGTKRRIFTGRRGGKYWIQWNGRFKYISNIQKEQIKKREKRKCDFDEIRRSKKRRLNKNKHSDNCINTK